MPAQAITVTELSATPVKGLRILRRRALRLEPGRVVGDRVFYLIDSRGRMVNGKRVSGLQTVSADYDERRGLLTFEFADGARLAAPIELGEEVHTQVYSSPRRARILRGPLAGALSQHVGLELRLVAPADGGSVADRGADGAVSLISRASLARLADVAGAGAVDARRFRMSIELDGVGVHEEDRWVGRSISLGEARIEIVGHVGRCLVTTRDPETDEVDLPTLDLLRSYRAGLATSEPLAFGVYGRVLRPGTVNVGDAVLPELFTDTAAG
jgi:uncharacterized protein